MSIKNDHRLDNSTTKVTIYRKNSTLIPKFLDVELDFFSEDADSFGNIKLGTEYLIRIQGTSLSNTAHVIGLRQKLEFYNSDPLVHFIVFDDSNNNLQYHRWSVINKQLFED